MYLRALLTANNSLTIKHMEHKYITVAYKLYTIEEGERDFAEEAPANHPFQFISGLGLTLGSKSKYAT